MAWNAYWPGPRHFPRRWSPTAVALLSVCWLAGISACGDASECETDSDCTDNQVCATSGGVFFGKKRCLPSGEIPDSEMRRDTTDAGRPDVEPDDADSGDETAPTDLNFDSLATGDIVTDTVNVAVSATDARSGVEELQISDSKGVVGSIRGSAGSLTWDTTSVTDGNQTLTLTATDTAGNQASSTLTVTVDNEAPSVAFTNPTEGDPVSGTITIDASASDSVTDVVEIRILIDGSTVVSSDTSSQTFSWSTMSTSDGSHTFTAEATDTAGNTSATTISVTVDNSAPNVKITNPTDGETVKGTVLVAVEANDSETGVANVELYVNGSKLDSSTGATLSTPWDTTNHLNNQVPITATAEDDAGNQAGKTIQVEVLNL